MWNFWASHQTRIKSILFSIPARFMIHKILSYQKLDLWLSYYFILNQLLYLYLNIWLFFAKISNSFLFQSSFPLIHSYFSHVVNNFSNFIMNDVYWNHLSQAWQNKPSRSVRFGKALTALEIFRLGKGCSGCLEFGMWLQMNFLIGKQPWPWFPN